MKVKQEFEKIAIQYLKNNRELLFQQYLDSKFPIDEKIAYFTAGPSGAVKQNLFKNFLSLKLILYIWT